MRNKIVLLLIILTFSKVNIGQNLEGNYYENSDYIMFKSDSASFKITSDGGFLIGLHATGKFKIIKEFLIVKTDYYTGLHSSFISTRKQNELTQIKVQDPNGSPIRGANLVFTNSLGKFISGTTTNYNGIAWINNNIEKCLLTISSLGYDTYRINYSSGLDYQVKLMDYEIIENNIVVFKINSFSNNSLNLTLLTTDYKYSVDSYKALKKLERKAEKFQYRNRVYYKKTVANTVNKVNKLSTDFCNLFLLPRQILDN